MVSFEWKPCCQDIFCNLLYYLLVAVALHQDKMAIFEISISKEMYGSLVKSTSVRNVEGKMQFSTFDVGLFQAHFFLRNHCCYVGKERCSFIENFFTTVKVNKLLFSQ